MIKTKRLHKFQRDWFYKREKDAPIYYLSRNTMTEEQMNEFFDWCLHWCYKKFGKVKGKPIPEIEWYWNNRRYQKENYLAEYVSEDNIISLRVQGHRTIYNLANTIIHEYIHYLQPTKGNWYSRYDNIHGYSNNPYEVEANYIGGLYDAECARTVLEWMGGSRGLRKGRSPRRGR